MTYLQPIHFPSSDRFSTTWPRVPAVLAILSALCSCVVFPAHATQKVWHQLPVEAPVTRGYDAPAQNWLPGHRGVDIAADDGGQIRASAAGTVHFAGMVAGKPVVSIMHSDGIRTTYQPVRTNLERGMQVNKGDPIGVLEKDGDHEGLHWGARRGEVYLNPLSLLRPRQVRLEPPRILN